MLDDIARKGAELERKVVKYGLEMSTSGHCSLLLPFAPLLSLSFRYIAMYLVLFHLSLRATFISRQAFFSSVLRFVGSDST